MVAQGLVRKWEWHPEEHGCLVYQLGNNVKDLVNGELINGLFSPWFPIDDAVLRPVRGGASKRNKVQHVASQARRQCCRHWEYTCACVCVQACMWLIVNNVALQPTRASEGGYFCQHAHVSHRGSSWLLCLSMCTQKPKPNERHNGVVCWKKKEEKKLGMRTWVISEQQQQQVKQLDYVWQLQGLCKSSNEPC